MTVIVCITGSLVLLGLGAYAGYRYALQSRKLDALIDEALDTVDLRPEDGDNYYHPNPVWFTHPDPKMDISFPNCPTGCLCRKQDPWSKN